MLPTCTGPAASAPGKVYIPSITRAVLLRKLFDLFFKNARLSAWLHSGWSTKQASYAHASTYSWSTWLVGFSFRQIYSETRTDNLTWYQRKVVWGCATAPAKQKRLCMTINRIVHNSNNCIHCSHRIALHLHCIHMSYASRKRDRAGGTYGVLIWRL